MHSPPLRIVLVDDDADHRALLRDRLLQLGLPVEVVGEAGDAASGLALIRTSDPDLVLLDIEMPGGSGLDLMQALQERRCEVVLVTAHPGHTHEALHLHAFYRERYGYAPGAFPNAEWVGERTLSLPLSAALDDRDVDDVIEAVLDVVHTHRRAATPVR